MQDGALLRIAPTPGRPAATLVEAGQAEWADYRAMMVLRVTAQGAIGLDVRPGGLAVSIVSP